MTEKKRELIPFNQGPGYKCAYCAHREHPENRIASTCNYDGRPLSVQEVFACYCNHFVKGKIA